MSYGLELITVVQSFVILYSILYFLGYLVSRFMNLTFSSEPFFVRLPIILSLGLITLIPVLFLIGLFVVSSLTIWIILTISVALFVNERKAGIFRKSQQFVTHLSVRQNILPFFLFFLTNLYFITTITQAGWPPPGDIMSVTGPLVSLILHNGKLPFFPNPLFILYPPAFHLMTATFNEMWGFYPAQSVFMFGALIAVLIPLMVYTLTFLLTRSKVYSFLGFCAVFIVDYTNLEKWTMGYFYNGVYPNFMGFLIVLTFATVLTLLQLGTYKTSTKKLKGYFLIVSLAFTSLILTYPPFAIFVLLHLAIILVILRTVIYRQVHKLAKALRNSKLKSSVLVVGLLITLIPLPYAFMKGDGEKFEVFSGYLTAVYVPGEHSRGIDKTWAAYQISIDSLFDSLGGALLMIGLPISIYLVVKKKKIDAALLYLIIATLLFLSLISQFSSFLSVILPRRSLVLLGVLTWPLTFKIITSLSRMHVRIKSHLQFPNSLYGVRLPTSKTVIAISVSALFAFCSLFPYMSYETNRKWLRFHTSPEDFKALEWIHMNIPARDLILDDATWTSEFVMSMSIKNLTYSYHSWVVFPERANALLNIWRKPFDGTTMFNLIRKYNVSYVFLTSEPRQMLWEPDFSYKYVSKPYTPEQYAIIFDQYPFLKVLYEEGSTRIYKVPKER